MSLPNGETLVVIPNHFASEGSDFSGKSRKVQSKRVKKVDVFRKGYYTPTKWKSFPNIDATTKEQFQASDHHCVWADIDLG